MWHFLIPESEMYDYADLGRSKHKPESTDPGFSFGTLKIKTQEQYETWTESCFNLSCFVVRQLLRTIIKWLVLCAAFVKKWLKVHEAHDMQTWDAMEIVWILSCFYIKVIKRWVEKKIKVHQFTQWKLKKALKMNI